MWVGVASAQPRELPARVLWTHDGVVYVASPDSNALALGMTLEFTRGRKRLGTAVVLRKLDTYVALARLGSGSLDREKRLEKLRVRGEVAAVSRLAKLRLGLPGRDRPNLLFRCSRTSVYGRFAGADYSTDTLRAGALRLVRTAVASEAASALLPAESAAAPDTLDVRLFTESADQEIALERGEIDVAVFWPGELSPRLRADPRWRDAARGLRSRGVLVALLPLRDTVHVREEALAAMNREAFGGDLLAWRELEPPAWTADGEQGARFEADPALPGAKLLERLLERAGGNPQARTVRLAYMDVALAAGDALGATWRTRSVQPLFALRCPVLVTPALSGVLARLGGADAFANLLRCDSSVP